MGILREIVRQPTDGEGLKLTPLVGDSFQAGVEVRLAAVGHDPDDREKRVGKGGIVPFVLIGKGDDEVAIIEILALAQASRDPGRDLVSDLFSERLGVVRKIDMAPGWNAGATGEEQNTGNE